MFGEPFLSIESLFWHVVEKLCVEIGSKRCLWRVVRSAVARQQLALDSGLPAAHFSSGQV